MKSWQLGQLGSFLYHLFDSLRQRVNRNIVNFLVGILNHDNNAIVMEAGSGPAYASTLLAKKPGIKLSIALDIDPAAIALARMRDQALPAVIADIYNLPFLSSSFDLIWNSSTIEHLDDPLPVLKEFSRLLKADGRIFIGVPYLYGPLGVQKLIPNTPAGIWIGKVFDHGSLKELLRAAGFYEKVFVKYFLNFFIGVVGEKSFSLKYPQNNFKVMEA